MSLLSERIKQKLEGGRTFSIDHNIFLDQDVGSWVKNPINSIGI